MLCVDCMMDWISLFCSMSTCRDFYLAIVFKSMFFFFFFFFNDPPPPEIYPLSLHDPLPISLASSPVNDHGSTCHTERRRRLAPATPRAMARPSRSRAPSRYRPLLCRPSTRARRCSPRARGRSEEHTSELQSRLHLVCRLLLE